MAEGTAKIECRTASSELHVNWQCPDIFWAHMIAENASEALRKVVTQEVHGAVEIIVVMRPARKGAK
jgi:hypothetical protein